MDNGINNNGAEMRDPHSPVWSKGEYSSYANRLGCDNDLSHYEFAERVPEYLREGYNSLMRRDGNRAIEMWKSIYERFPSAEVCGHLARAHYYQIYFLGHDGNHPKHAEHIREMRRWAERALCLNSNSSIGHAMLAGALGREAQLTGSRKEVIRGAWQVRHHAERAVQIDNNWIGHYILALWHCELASLKPGVRTVVQIFNGRKIPRGTYEEAIEHFNKVLEIFPQNNVIYAEMACTYYEMGDLAKAREAYRQCLASPMFRHPIAPCFIENIRKRFDSILCSEPQVV
ncbi:MAG: tetratricopeptide repeat protein [Candidatus Kapaibacterium sp.]